MGVSPRIHSPYHPEASGVIERFNGTFKNMLNHAIRDYGRQWHKVVPCLVWSLREVPNRTISVSPYFPLFGRVPRGPLTVLQESWLGQREDMGGDDKPVDQYICEVSRVRAMLLMSVACNFFCLLLGLLFCCLSIYC